MPIVQQGVCTDFTQGHANALGPRLAMLAVLALRRFALSAVTHALQCRHKMLVARREWLPPQSRNTTRSPYGGQTQIAPPYPRLGGAFSLPPPPCVRWPPPRFPSAAGRASIAA